jgi:prepilin-type N-terminal cleavage/methylation domain-containing protein
MKKQHGFTLIELLIVVAIIAILAAIAVPNFLEAQTRSKVSRAKSDIRTLTTAIEMYAVDFNQRYPFDLDSRGYPYVMTDVISTPIAYLTSGSALEDPFRLGGTSTGNLAARRYRYLYYEAHRDANYSPSPIPAPKPTRSQAGQTTLPVASTLDAGVSAFGFWKITSSGPDKTANSTFFTGDLPYDPTNGTISGGDIIRSQKTGQRN